MDETCKAIVVSCEECDLDYLFPPHAGKVKIEGPEGAEILRFYCPEHRAVIHRPKQRLRDVEEAEVMCEFPFRIQARCGQCGKDTWIYSAHRDVVPRAPETFEVECEGHRSKATVSEAEKRCELLWHGLKSA